MIITYTLYYFLTPHSSFFSLVFHLLSNRSQMLNKAQAMLILKEKLIAIAQDQALADFNDIKGEQVFATFGQQIRNYVFAPYKLVKDTRTNFETSQVQDVMDGDLDPFIAAYLRSSANGKKPTASNNNLEEEE